MSSQEDGCAVNAGVYLLDVKQYASHKIQERIAKLISIHEQRLEGVLSTEGLLESTLLTACT